MSEPRAIVIKIGGTSGVNFSAVTADVASLVKEEQRIVVVHGGSGETNAISEQLGHPPQFVTSPSGFTSRYTDRTTLEIFAMVTSGKINSLIVERLQSLGVNALGLSGLDGRLMEARRKEAIRIIDPSSGKQRMLRDDFTGKIEHVNGGLLHMLLDAGYTPVIAPLAISSEGPNAERVALNVDADRAAAMVAGALQAEQLIILSNVPGLLRNFPDESTLIAHIDKDKVEASLEFAEGRMKQKVLGASEAAAGDGRPGNCDLMNIIELETQHTSGLYAKRDIALVRGEGALLWDSNGKQYIDCDSGHGVANLGHGRPEIVKAISEQAGRLITCFESYYNDQRAQLLEKLTALAPGLSRAYLCNSGAESVEAALKLARFSTGRAKIIAAMRGFHGRTMGALSATWNKSYRQPFEPLVPEFTPIAYNNVEALRAAVDGETAAVVLEAVQGEGGIHVGSDDFMRTAQELCHQHGALLIIDEVQSGFARTGKMFAYQHIEGLAPDLLCVAKSIAGGLPMGATLIGPRVKPLQPGLHSSTFGGNPLSCAASLAALEIFARENLAQQSAEKGQYFLERLRQIQSPLIREVRGLGLMVGVELKQKIAPYIRALMEHGVLALPSGLTVLRFLPPLVISFPQLDLVAETIEAVLNQPYKDDN